MDTPIFKRKIYDQILEWKENRSDKYALLATATADRKSLDVFCNKYSSRIGDKFVVHTKEYKWENSINYIPAYMVPFI